MLHQKGKRRSGCVYCRASRKVPREGLRMRRVLLALASLLVLGVSALLGARMQADGAKVRLRLVDAQDGTGQAGVIRLLRTGTDEPLQLTGPLPRLRGVEGLEKSSGWYVLPADGAALSLPRARLTVEAFSGVETALARQDLDLTAAAPDEVKVKLPFLFRPEKDDLAAGNTHLHLRGLTAEESDDYLRQVPAADRLKVLFISYLERYKDDEAYITNRYPVGDLRQFDVTGVLLNNGEEHRHNFGASGQGYGHV